MCLNCGHSEPHVVRRGECPKCGCDAPYYESATLTVGRGPRSTVPTNRPKTSMFAVSSIIFPSVTKHRHTLKSLRRKENRPTPFGIMESSTQQTEVTMAPGRWPEPGTEYGPCEGACQHRDCASVRRYVASACGICGEPIGYDTAFFRADGDDPEAFEHALCVFREMDKADAS